MAKELEIQQKFSEMGRILQEIRLRS